MDMDSMMLRAASVLLLAAFAHAATSNNPGYELTPRSSINGEDIDCGQTDYDGNPQPFCSISGGVTDVADACDANPACKSFVMEGSYSGFLKSGGSPTYTEGYNTFCRAGTEGCSDIKGNDVDCNYKENGTPQKYCIVTGDLSNQLSACTENPSCKAVTVENDYEGYLKTAESAGSGVREGFVTYVKN